MSNADFGIMLTLKLRLPRMAWSKRVLSKHLGRYNTASFPDSKPRIKKAGTMAPAIRSYRMKMPQSSALIPYGQGAADKAASNFAPPLPNPSLFAPVPIWCHRRIPGALEKRCLNGRRNARRYPQLTHCRPDYSP